MIPRARGIPRKPHECGLYIGYICTLARRPSHARRPPMAVLLSPEPNHHGPRGCHGSGVHPPVGVEFYRRSRRRRRQRRRYSRVRTNRPGLTTPSVPVEPRPPSSLAFVSRHSAPPLAPPRPRRHSLDNAGRTVYGSVAPSAPVLSQAREIERANANFLCLSHSPPTPIPPQHSLNYTRWL